MFKVETTTHEAPSNWISRRASGSKSDWSLFRLPPLFPLSVLTHMCRLDQENAVEEDEETFDPDQDLRDYDEVARTLPVFCVSSRAYQSLSGRFQKDDINAAELGFPEAKDTEVPQLQQHAKKLTEAGRASNCRRFLNDFSQLTNSLKFWASTDGAQSHLTDTEKRREDVFLRKLLQSLEDVSRAFLQAFAMAS